jgi:hypothetical protein
LTRLPQIGVKTRKCTNCPARVNDTRTAYAEAGAVPFASVFSAA